MSLRTIPPAHVGNRSAAIEGQSASQSSGNRISAEVYNLTILIRTSNGSGVSARAANLNLPIVQAATVRAALQKTVEIAKETIVRERNQGAEIPWLDPPNKPLEAESTFVVPLHV